MKRTTCKNCSAPVAAGRVVCSMRCRAELGAKSRHASNAKRDQHLADSDCPYCRSGSMPRHADGFHYTKNRRRYPCATPQRGGQARPQDLVSEATADVHSALEAAVQREIAPPWERHPQPWDNVVHVRPNTN